MKYSPSGLSPAWKFCLLSVDHWSGNIGNWKLELILVPDNFNHRFNIMVHRQLFGTRALDISQKRVGLHIATLSHE